MFHLLTTFTIYTSNSINQYIFTSKKELYQTLQELDFDDYCVESFEYDEHCPHQDELFKAVQKGTIASF